MVRLRKMVGMLAVLVCAACAASNARVMPGVNGQNKVMAEGRNQGSASKSAIDSATKYCQKQGKQAVFGDEVKKYNGTFDEKTDKVIKGASNAAWMLGRTSESAATDAAMGQSSYDVTIPFQCQ